MRAVVIGALLAGCGHGVHVVEKGPPQHVLMEAAESPARLVFLASREGSRVELALKQQLTVSVERTVVYGSSETYMDTEWKTLWWELIEIPFGVVLLPTLFVRMDANFVRPAGQVDVSTPVALVLLNPFRRFLANTVRAAVPTERIQFKDPPRDRTYSVKLPVEGAPISYKILDDARATIASGSGTTDMFGAIAIEDVGDNAVGIEATSGSTTALVPIR